MDERCVSLTRLHQFCCDALEAVGVPSPDAATVATSLTRADARGLASHGVVRLLPVYVSRLRKGSTHASPDIHVERRCTSTVLVDGDAGLGQVVGAYAMGEACRIAAETGSCIAAVHNSSHFGYGALFVEQAVEAGMIGMGLTNAPSNMPPWGGRKPFFGTNPIAVGIPAGAERPVILDMSTSVVACGKIIMAEKAGETIPEGWAIDADGRSTTDATAALAGAVLPFGGYKGSGLALLVDVLCGVLTGAAFGLHIVNLYDESDEPQNVGHFFVALDPQSFMPIGDFRERMDQCIREMRSQPRMPGHDRIFVPGEIEYERELGATKNGISLQPSGVMELDALADDLHISRL